MVLTRAAQAKKTDTVPPPDKPTKEPARKGKRKAQDEAASKDDVAAAKPEPKKRATRKAVKPEVEEPVKPEAEELVQPMIEEPKRKATRAATRSTATTKAATKEVATKTKAPAVAAPVATTRTRTSSRTKKTEAEDKKNEQPKEKVAAKPKTTKRASAKPFTENTKSSVTKKNQDPKVETIEEKEEPQGPKSPEMFHTITVQLPSALAMKTAPPLSSKLAYTQTPVSKPVQVAQESHIPVLVDANIAEQQGEIIEDISPFKSSSVFGKRGLKFKNSLLQSSPRKMPSFTPSRLFSPGKAEIISKQGSTSLLKNSPRKPPVETSHLSSPARRNASNEADTQHRESVLAASPRRIKLASPSKLAADLFGSSSTRPNLFSSSFLKLSPMRPKYPAIVPVPSPLREPSSLGTPMRSPARRFFSPKKDVSPDRMVDETIMFGEPEFHCSVQSVVEAAVEPSTTPELEIVQESEEGITGIAQELPVDCVEETKLATELESEMAAALEAAVEGDVFAITPQKQEEELFEAPKPVQKLRFSPSKSSLKSPEKKAPESPKKTVTWDQLTVTPTAPKPADPAVNAGILAGTIFFVDVCSAEGANCNDIFSPLLFELGATVVGSWVSNVSGIGGITHVLFKDGQRRTLEKVIASNGSVKCVNIAWALEYVTAMYLTLQDSILTIAQLREI